MSNEHWFEEARQQSEVKSAIVAKYFWAWAKVIISTAKQTGKTDRIAYIDLFAGPGRFKDGTRSTPLLILEQAIQDPDMRQMLVSILNDVDSDHVRSLEEAILALPGIDTMRFRPQVWNREVGTEIVADFEKMKLVPTLFFVDPWGYKGLSLRLINSVLKDWGCDCIVFFNYNRINMGLSNEFVEDHMDALFGKERAASLRPCLEGLSPVGREQAIVDALCGALRDMGGRYVLPFRFRHPTQGRTSHHLIFVSKHPRGYTIMKGIMAKESSDATQGVPSFEYNPVEYRQGLLFELSRPLDDLLDLLLTAFAGQTRSFKDIFDRHNVDRPYVEANYREALGRLEEAGRVVVVRPPKSRKTHGGRPSYGPDVTIRFPAM